MLSQSYEYPKVANSILDIQHLLDLLVHVFINWFIATHKSSFWISENLIMDDYFYIQNLIYGYLESVFDIHKSKFGYKKQEINREYYVFEDNLATY